MRGIHQLVPGGGPGDAITNLVLDIRQIIRDEGFTSQIFGPESDISPLLFNKEIFPAEKLEESTQPGDLLLYNYSIGSPMTDIFKAYNSPKGIMYHNITPYEYFLPFSDCRATVLKKGRDDLKTLPPHSPFSIAGSEYNKRELLSLGFDQVETIPMVIATDYLNTPPDPSFMKPFQDGKTNILFVGRVAPNKRFENLLRTFCFYKALNPNSRLILSGSYVGMESYFRYLKGLCYDLKLTLTEDVFFLGHIVLKELISCYHLADAFLCLSEHEGFCIPLIEAMYFKVPVFALNRAAVPDTLGESAISFDEMNPKKIAFLLHQVLKEKDLLPQILKKQEERVRSFSVEQLKQRFTHLIHNYFTDKNNKTERNHKGNPHESK